ncbi:DUF1178 family protein [Microvirga tunisiensis]|uniref:DUF1178 family protein n=1 Tax=Pannonibacter tanglangensis TaxID=2750084 RepID=A0A7X5F6C2_9HYPH|nr:DUF1178 family protein [Pannonibacter sp. XCT-53]
MIRYSLLCDNAHGFEAWFRNSGDYDAQSARGLVSCPVCGSPVVTKALMAPAVATAEKREERQQAAAAVAAGPSPAAVPAPEPVTPGVDGTSSAALIPSDARYAELVGKLRELRAQMTANADYVGSSFAEEARKMHYGETDHRNIYGETNADDARSLLEEGISILPLPVLPDDRN